jgi:hypothetical protein
MVEVWKIVTMDRRHGLHVVESAIRFFEERGLYVKVKNGHGDPILALLGSKPNFSVWMPFGVKKCETDNGFFAEHRDEFMPAPEYIRVRETR